MVVLEGDQPLGADAHRYYDELVKRFNAGHQARRARRRTSGATRSPPPARRAPTARPPTSRCSSSGNQGEALSLESVDALRDIIAKTPAPPGIHAYVAGSAAQIADQFEVGNESTVMVTLLTVGVIAHDVAHRLPLAGHHDPGARHGAHRDVRGPRDRRVPGERRASSACRRIRPTSSRCWSSPPVPTTSSSCSAAITSGATKAWTGRPPSTTCTAGRRT